MSGIPRLTDAEISGVFSQSMWGGHVTGGVVPVVVLPSEMLLFARAVESAVRESIATYIETHFARIHTIDAVGYINSDDLARLLREP